MKRTLFFLLIFLAPLPTWCQEKLKIDTIIQAPSINQQTIYNASREWFVDNMKSSKHVIQLDNPTEGIIIAKYNIEFPVNHFVWHPLSGYINITIKIQAKDGRYRIQMYDFIHEAGPKSGESWNVGMIYTEKPEFIKGSKAKVYNEMQKRALPLIKLETESTIKSIQEKINSYKSDNDDW